MAKVKALYSYTYDYEGSQISFCCGDEFQLLAKVNNDWWHVRRWISQGPQDLYIPAVYVKEVGQEDNPLYQNMEDLKKQVEDFKKKASSTPPPPTAKKPRHDRAGSEKTKAAAAVAIFQSSPEHKTAETESVADRAKKLVENLQAKKHEDDFPIPKTGSGSPLVAPKRVQSTRRNDNPAFQQKLPEGTAGGGPVANVLAVSLKPRSRSINARPVAERRDKDSVSPPDMHRNGGDQQSSAVKTMGGVVPVKIKLPPPVLPKGGKINRPKSMVMLSPTEDQEKDEQFTSAVQSQLTEQMKKVRSVTSVGATTAAPGRDTDQKMTSQQQLEDPVPAAGGKPVQNGELPHMSTSATLSPPSSSSSSPLPAPQQYVLPDGWTEHKTNEGHTYYYNAASGKSSWTRPPSAMKTTPTTSPTSQTSNPLEIAPRGWTKEINPLSQTPVYTSSRTGERWALAKDATGNYYYYNMSNSQMTVRELPSVNDTSTSTANDTLQENTISPPATGNNEIPVLVRANSETRVKTEPSVPLSPSHSQPSSMFSAQLEVVQYSLAHMQLKKHGYMQRKRLFDAQGKRAKGGWQRVYVSLDNFQLKFYTEHKTAIEASAKPLSTFHLLQATVCTYTREKKIKNTFQVSSPFGEQFLLQADSAPQMNDWYSTIQTTVHKANEDYKLHPDKYCDLVPEGDGEISPKTPGGKHRRKPSKDIQPTSMAMDEDEELDDMELSDKSDRIRTRLRRLMARRPQMETLQKKGIIEDPVFGADLAKYCERKKTLVPQFLLLFMEHIENHDLDSVGLYRLSGNAAYVQKLRCLVEQDEPFDLNDPEWADINIVTGCLKLYFRELPDPLIPANKFQAFIDAVRIATTPAQRITALAAQVKELPKINYCTLIALMKHLRRVMDNGSVNKMHSQNVAIVFGPTLLRSEGDPFEMAKLTPVQNGIVEVMLIEFEKIFTRKI